MLIVDDRYEGDEWYNERGLTDIIVAKPTHNDKYVAYIRVAEQSSGGLWIKVDHSSVNNYLEGNPTSGHGLVLNIEELTDLITVLVFMKNKLEEKNLNYFKKNLTYFKENLT